jgi:hypothetical protein
MGHKLYRMIKRGAPASWDAGMRLVALAIADEAGDASRRTYGYRIEGYPRPHGKGWRDGICQDTGLKPAGVTGALARLAAAGYEMRVPIGKDKAARVVYAARGHHTDYQVPDLPARPVPECSPEPGKGRLQPAHDAGMGRSQPALSRGKGRSEPAHEPRKGRLQPAPIPSEDLSPQKSKPAPQRAARPLRGRAAALADVQNRAGVTGDQAAEILAAIDDERDRAGRPPVGDWPAFITAFSPAELRARLPWSYDRQEQVAPYEPLWTPPPDGGDFRPGPALTGRQ